MTKIVCTKSTRNPEFRKSPDSSGTAHIRHGVSVIAFGVEQDGYTLVAARDSNFKLRLGWVNSTFLK